MIEQRITVRLQKYWDYLRKEQDIPRVSAFRSKHISNLWNHCFVVNVVPGLEGEKDELVYDHIGMEFLSFYGQSVSRRGEAAYNCIVDTYKFDIPDAAREAINTKAPFFKDRAYKANDADFEVLYRMGIFPLADKNGKIVKLFGGMRWASKDIVIEF